MNSDYILKYRPKDFDDVVGHSAVVKSLKTIIQNKSGHSFIFTGPSGVGKTTLARILAGAVGCSSQNLMEIDAATHTGVDAMRDITERIQFKAIGDSPIRAVVIDEAHALSKAAWQSLLKSIEEPPSHVYWIFCTTESGKIPKTIVTRCKCFDLKPVKHDDLMDLLVSVVELEGLKFSDSDLALLAREADGSPRQALSFLSICSSCSSRTEMIELIRSASESDVVIEFCRELVKGKMSWTTASDYVVRMGSSNPESIRSTVCAYLAKVVLSTKDPECAAVLLNYLRAFSDSQAGLSQYNLLLSTAECVFS